MRFALFTHVPWPEGTESAQIFAETIELAPRFVESKMVCTWRYGRLKISGDLQVLDADSSQFGLLVLKDFFFGS